MSAVAFATMRRPAHTVPRALHEVVSPRVQLELLPGNDVEPRRRHEFSQVSVHAGDVTLQRDLARPPAAPRAVARGLTPDEIRSAIAFNVDRFQDPYSIRVIRDVLGLEPVPAVVDEALVHA